MTLTHRPARFTAVLRPSPRLPPVLIATLCFKVPTVSFAVGTPFAFCFSPVLRFVQRDLATYVLYSPHP
jgi:hypothetical protein